jgi:hypothetical protein
MFPLTTKEKIGGCLDAAERELAYQKRQPLPDANAIAISKRAVQRLRDQYALITEASSA